VSVPLAFAVSWVVSVMDRSAAAISVRASFGAQHVRAQTGLGAD
jgi:cation/acetate symporter